MVPPKRPVLIRTRRWHPDSTWCNYRNTEKKASHHRSHDPEPRNQGWAHKPGLVYFVFLDVFTFVFVFSFLFCCKESQSWSRTTKGERPSLENSQSVGKWSATLARKRKLSENRPTLRLNLDQDGFAALAQSNIIIKNHFERGNNFTKCSLCYHLVGICCTS